MNQTKDNSSVEKRELVAEELAQKELILFVLAHTRTLTEAVTYLKMTASTLLRKRKKYKIPTPTRNSYAGPKLTHREMADAFWASRAAAVQPAAAALQPVMPSLNLTFVPPTDSVSNVPSPSPSMGG